MSITSLLIVQTVLVLASAKGFMRKAATQEEVEASLLTELAATFRPSAKNDHVNSLEIALRPMYAAVPQEIDGTLSHTVVRYVLHRFFAQRGWFIRGLEPAGNSSETMQDLQEWVPSFLQSFLEQLAGGRGISLRELAVLAATIEDLVHKESIGRLEQTFNALNLPLDKKLNDAQTREVLEVFMMIYMLGGNFSASSPEEVRSAHVMFAEKVTDWAEVQEWMHEVQTKIHSPRSGPLDFDAAVHVVEEIGAKYGEYNTKECHDLKIELLDIESQKAGRVRLVDFYKKGLTGVFEFNEKVEYLRVLGALDESNPKDPHVIVPNYVGSRPNCLAASNFYAICCTNECEDLMGKLEIAIAAEMASPEQIVSLVSAFDTDTVSTPRKLSNSLVQRLQGIANNNGGQVPLHGRLFAQWMHHAFPRECPYPHETGSTNPQTPDEWMQETGHKDSKASVEEMMFHVEKETCADGTCAKRPTGLEARKHHHFSENELPWSEFEELLLPAKTTPGGGDARPAKPLRKLAILASLLSMAAGLVLASKPLLSAGTHSGKPAKGYTELGLGSTDFFKIA